MAMNIESNENAERAGRILVLGMGNTLVSDDGVGITIAREVKYLLDARRKGGQVDIIETCASGPALMLILSGYESAIVIDSIKTAGGVPGEIREMLMENMQETRNTASPHSMNLFTAVELGRRLGLGMPSRIRIVAVEADDVETVCEKLTPAVAGAVPGAAEIVCVLLEKQFNL